jgi:hypothetical protein
MLHRDEALPLSIADDKGDQVDDFGVRSLSTSPCHLGDRDAQGGE